MSGPDEHDEASANALNAVRKSFSSFRTGERPAAAAGYEKDRGAEYPPNFSVLERRTGELQQQLLDQEKLLASTSSQLKQEINLKDIINEKASTLEIELAEQREENDHLKSAMITLNSELAAESDSAETLRAQLKSMTKIKEEAEEMLREKNKLLLLTTGQRDSAKIQLESLKISTETSEVRETELTHEAVKAHHEIAETQVRVRALEQSEAALKHEYKKLSLAHDNAKAEVTQLKGRLMESLNAKRDVDIELTEFQAKYFVNQTSTNDTDANEMSMMNRLSELHIQVNTAEARATAMQIRADRDRQITEELQVEVDALQRRNLATTQSREHLDMRIKEIFSGKAALGHSPGDIEKLFATVVAEKENLEDRVTNLTSELRLMDRRISESQAAHTSSVNLRIAAESKMAVRERKEARTVEEFAELSEQIKTISSKLDDTDRENAALKGQWLAMRRTHDESLINVRELEEERARCELKIAELQHQEQLATLRSLVSEKQAVRADADKVMQMKLASDARHSVEGLTKALQSNERQTMVLSHEVGDASSKMESVNSQLLEVTAERDHHMERAESAQEEGVQLFHRAVAAERLANVAELSRKETKTKLDLITHKALEATAKYDEAQELWLKAQSQVEETTFLTNSWQKRIVEADEVNLRSVIRADQAEELLIVVGRQLRGVTTLSENLAQRCGEIENQALTQGRKAHDLHRAMQNQSFGAKSADTAEAAELRSTISAMADDNALLQREMERLLQETEDSMKVAREKVSDMHRRLVVAEEERDQARRAGTWQLQSAPASYITENHLGSLELLESLERRGVELVVSLAYLEMMRGFFRGEREVANAALLASTQSSLSRQQSVPNLTRSNSTPFAGGTATALSPAQAVALTPPVPSRTVGTETTAPYPETPRSNASPTRTATGPSQDEMNALLGQQRDRHRTEMDKLQDQLVVAQAEVEALRKEVVQGAVHAPQPSALPPPVSVPVTSDYSIPTATSSSSAVALEREQSAHDATRARLANEVQHWKQEVHRQSRAALVVQEEAEARSRLLLGTWWAPSHPVSVTTTRTIVEPASPPQVVIREVPAPASPQRDASTQSAPSAPSSPVAATTTPAPPPLSAAAQIAASLTSSPKVAVSTPATPVVGGAAVPPVSVKVPTAEFGAQVELISETPPPAASLPVPSPQEESTPVTAPPRSATPEPVVVTKTVEVEVEVVVPTGLEVSHFEAAFFTLHAQTLNTIWSQYCAWSTGFVAMVKEAWKQTENLRRVKAMLETDSAEQRRQNMGLKEQLREAQNVAVGAVRVELSARADESSRAQAISGATSALNDRLLVADLDQQRLHQELTATRRSMETLQEALDEKIRELDEYLPKLAQAEGELERTQADLQAMTRARQEADARVNDLTEQRDVLQPRCDEQGELIKSLEEAMLQMKKQSSYLNGGPYSQRRKENTFQSMSGTDAGSGVMEDLPPNLPEFKISINQAPVDQSHRRMATTGCQSTPPTQSLLPDLSFTSPHPGSPASVNASIQGGSTLNPHPVGQNSAAPGLALKLTDVAERVHASVNARRFALDQLQAEEMSWAAKRGCDTLSQFQAMLQQQDFDLQRRVIDQEEREVRLTNYVRTTEDRMALTARNEREARFKTEIALQHLQDMSKLCMRLITQRRVLHRMLRSDANAAMDRADTRKEFAAVACQVEAALGKEKSTAWSTTLSLLTSDLFSRVALPLMLATLFTWLIYTIALESFEAMGMQPAPIAAGGTGE